MAPCQSSRPRHRDSRCAGSARSGGGPRAAPDPDPDVGPIAESTACFVAAEGVTNARKHAPGAVVTVRACTAGDQLVLTVSDTGPGGADPSGAGLRGLADRVEACGGRFTVDPAGDSSAGTTLTARLPA